MIKGLGLGYSESSRLVGYWLMIGDVWKHVVLNVGSGSCRGIGNQLFFTKKDSFLSCPRCRLTCLSKMIHIYFQRNATSSPIKRKKIHRSFRLHIIRSFTWRQVSVLHRVICYNARNPEKRKRKRIMTTFLISVARFYKQIPGEPSSRYDTHDRIV